MVLTVGQFYNCLDDFHNCFISYALRAFSKCHFNGIAETFLINFFAGTVDLCIFVTAFGCGFWCAVSVVQIFFFSAFRGVTEWLVPGLGFWIIFQIVLSFR